MNNANHEVKDIKKEITFEDGDDYPEANSVLSIKHEPLDIDPDEIQPINGEIQSEAAEIHSFKCPDPDCGYSCELDGVLNMHIRLQHEGQELGLIEPPQNIESVEDESNELVIDPSGPAILIERMNKRRSVIHTCSRCGTGFRKREVAEAHIAKVHMVVKRFTCSVCGRGFDRSGDLEVHTRVHTGVRPYKCPAEGCDYSASITNTLQRHVRRRHKELADSVTTSSANDVKKKFTGLEDSAKPSKKSAAGKSGTTAPKKFYDCSDCYVKFSRIGSLRAHRNAVHSKEKIFKCSYCEVTVPSSRILAKHILLHDEVKSSYPCTFAGCQFTFISEADQKRHIRKHEKQIDPSLKPYVCEICGKRFELKCGIVRHMSALHPQEIADKQAEGEADSDGDVKE